MCTPARSRFSTPPTPLLLLSSPQDLRLWGLTPRALTQDLFIISGQLSSIHSCSSSLHRGYCAARRLITWAVTSSWGEAQRHDGEEEDEKEKQTGDLSEWSGASENEAEEWGRACSRAGEWAARSFKQRDSVKWNGNEKECQPWKTADNWRCNLFAEPPTVLSAWVFGESIARLYLSVLHYSDATHTHSSENAIYYAALCATGVVRETTSVVRAGTVEDSEQASWLKARSKSDRGGHSLPIRAAKSSTQVQTPTCERLTDDGLM